MEKSSEDKAEKKFSFLTMFLYFLEGILVGFGAILPGISGGTLCVAFRMYQPLLFVLSHPIAGLKRYFFRLFPFVLGGGVGFVCLSGVAGWFLKEESTLAVCVFIGFIVGTFPGLFRDAGKKEREEGKQRGLSSYLSLLIGFSCMLLFLLFLRNQSGVQFEPGLPGYILCGILWGLSFIVPGLSSSTILLFLGLYQPMLDGISHFLLPVLIPLGISAVLCVLLLSRLVSLLFERFYTVISHAIIGIVAATTLLLVPIPKRFTAEVILQAGLVLVGALISYFLTSFCEKLDQKNEATNRKQ